MGSWPRIVRALGLVLTIGLIAGCSPNPPIPGLSPSPEESTYSTALGLVNLWRVTNAEGEGPDTWLRLDGDGFDLWRDCGTVSGSWRANDEMFVAHVDSFSTACTSDSQLVLPPDWLDEATSYRASGDGWELIGGTDQVVASLQQNGAPDPRPDISRRVTIPPTITAEVRALHRAFPALPAELSPVVAAELTGKWIPVGARGATEPYVEFDSSGRWSGSDGCNSVGGRWITDDAGSFLAAVGMTTAMGCPGSDVGGLLFESRLAGIDGDELVLLDGDAVELGRLMRVTEQTELDEKYVESALDVIEVSRQDPDAPAAFRTRGRVPFHCGDWVTKQGDPRISQSASLCMRNGMVDGADLAVASPTPEGDLIITFYRVGPNIDGIQVFADAIRDNFGSQTWTERMCHPAQFAFPPDGCA